MGADPQNSVFEGYIGGLPDEYQRLHECSRTQITPQGKCDLFGDRIQMIKSLKAIKSQEDAPLKEYQVTNIYKLSNQICRDLEAWISTRKISNVGGRTLLTGGCSYTQYTNKEKGSGDVPCSPRNDLLKWANLTAERVTQRTNRDHRSLRLCMELVTIMMIQLELTDTSKSVNLQMAIEKNYCQGVFQALRQWGNEKIARKIMNQWFTFQDREQEQNPQYEIGGQDLFEALSASNKTRGVGNKDLNCKWKSRQATGGMPIEEQLTTVKSLDTTINSVPIGKQTQEQGDAEKSQTDGPPGTRDGVLSNYLSEKPESQSKAPGPGGGGAQSSPSVKIGASDDVATLHEMSGGAGDGQIGELIGGVIASILGGLGAYGVWRIFRGRRQGGTGWRRGGPGVKVVSYGQMRE
ncbi:hypothetical protein C922_05324 [Plasmodium inui San Antonio 1]|uniref:Uncharacterized protein n=1 Tax=Plasmodium inui San Antonio 1 TaxID=1237626 RepID=W6ZTQ7_9APIC|nr:hypothetical protein C922_05324 [Plasmodium inui San Antonio 1]EUD64292.1 hypothetical protein C922_05324 [Plasmodium inui San Antonio 1]